MFGGAAHEQALARLAPRARSVRFGGDCYTPCLVAGGWADLVVEAGLKPWDVQALIPIVQGAGGVITDWSGGPADRASEVIIAANRPLHSEVVAALAWSVPGEK
jgi:myo-inositol-1(or 4)-monophosphatase